jgi:hypothetical protein
MYGNMWIQTSAALPVLHISTTTKLLGQVINAILPLVEVHATEAAPRLDVLGFRFPGVHAGRHLASVH